MRVERYQHAQKSRWDDFVLRSKNGTFLFLRDYMDYHRDRFADHSLLISLPDGEPLALLPANQEGDTLVSHGGLTYGGFITDDRMRSVLMLEVFEMTLAFARDHDIHRVVYKTIPHIYHRVPAEEDRYALLRFGAALARRDVLSVVRSSNRVELQERRVRGIRKAEAHGVRIECCEDYEGFWQILEKNLSTVHQVRPVHTLAEMHRLRATFPDNIKLYAAFLGPDIVAGTIIYEAHTVAHAQYIAASELGRSCRALDLLFHHLLADVYRHKQYFDFGISTENDGRDLNAGLVEFKEGFGARAVAHDFYELRTEL
jgi:hypothetical protein